MVPAAVAAMLACSRIGAVVTVVFAGFSDTALSQRLLASQAKVLITADTVKRGGKTVQLKATCDAAMAQCEEQGLQPKCLVYDRHDSCSMKRGRDLWYQDLVQARSSVENYPI